MDYYSEEEINRMISELPDLTMRHQMRERSLFFHMERLLKQDLFDLATSRQAVHHALSHVTLPGRLIDDITAFLAVYHKEFSGEAVEDLVFGQVLAHKILQLPKPKNWNRTAREAIDDLDDEYSEDRIAELLRKAAAHHSKDDIIKALAHVDITLESAIERLLP